MLHETKNVQKMQNNGVLSKNECSFIKNQSYFVRRHVINVSKYIYFCLFSQKKMIKICFINA
jgi:hypothetical protein